MIRTVQPHPIAAIESARAAVRRAADALYAAERNLGAVVLDEARRQLPGVALYVAVHPNPADAWHGVWWGSATTGKGITIDGGVRSTDGAWSWCWEAWVREIDGSVFGRGETIRAALANLAAQYPVHAGLVAELLAEVTP